MGYDNSVHQYQIGNAFNEIFGPNYHTHDVANTLLFAARCWTRVTSRSRTNVFPWMLAS